MVVSAGGGGRWWLQVVLRCWQALGAPTSSEVSSVEARYSLVTSMRTRDALRSGELTPRKETGPCHAETTRDADIASILERARRWIQRRLLIAWGIFCGLCFSGDKVIKENPAEAGATKVMINHFYS